MLDGRGLRREELLVRLDDGDGELERQFLGTSQVECRTSVAEELVVLKMFC